MQVKSVVVGQGAIVGLDRRGDVRTPRELSARLDSLVLVLIGLRQMELPAMFTRA